jgi:hypothetical protein
MGSSEKVIQQSLTNSGISVARQNSILLSSTILRARLSYQANLALASTAIAIDKLIGFKIRSNQVDRLELPWHEN